MKIFWSKNVGRRENGHSVIFLGLTARPDGEYVRFWSSNLPGGYGEKEVPRAKVAAAIFSRLMNPENLSRIHGVPATDAYLASLLRKKSSLAERARTSSPSSLLLGSRRPPTTRASFTATPAGKLCSLATIA